jgi:hypothetical protein
LNPHLFSGRHIPGCRFAGPFVCRAIMEELFEFLFGAKGRINRANTGARL